MRTFSTGHCLRALDVARQDAKHHECEGHESDGAGDGHWRWAARQESRDGGSGRRAADEGQSMARALPLSIELAAHSLSLPASLIDSLCSWSTALPVLSR